MSTAIATRPVDTLKVALGAPKMAAWLQKQVHASLNRNATQMINIVLQAASQNESLAKCTPGSILANLCLAAQIGLVPNTALGHAYILPFLNSRKQGNQWIKVYEAQLIIGYKGYVKLIYDAGEVVTQAQAVYQGDEFDYDLACFPPVKHHRPGARDTDHLTAAWCHLQTPRGKTFGQVLTRKQIEKRRAVSKSYLDREGKPRKDSPWVLWEEEMFAKTAVRHALKLTPTGNDERLERALTADDESRDNPADIIDMSDAPSEVRDLDAAAIEAAQALPPQNSEELDQIRMEFASCDTLKGLDEVAAKVPQHLRESVNRSYIENADRVRGNGRRG